MVALLLALGACAAPAASGRASSSQVMSNLPRTRAERTDYRETSHYSDVIDFLDSLQALHAPVWIGDIGTTTEGRAIPLVVLSRPLVTTPAQAKRLGRPVVYVQANIHAGEVEGKEALLALIRDLAFDPHPNVLDSVVMLAVPIYNADGNERFAPQEQNRREQNGPEMVGTRANAQGLDLNRDYVKAEAPETRASLAAFNAWDPDVFMDLHTTDGSFHGYALTYAPSLNPAAFFGGVYARDSLLPVVRQRMREHDGFETYDYGNFGGNFNAGYQRESLTDTVKHGWYSYEPTPRYGTNYYGVRGRIAILSEAFSHDPFERRVKSTYAFVHEVLSYTAEHGDQIVALSRRADSTVTAWGAHPASAPKVPIRSEITKTPVQDDILVEKLVSTGDSSRTQPGVPVGLRRTGHIITEHMPVYVRFTPTLEQSLPYAYAIPASEADALRLLRLHGVVVERLTQDWTTQVQHFTIDSVQKAARPFQGHHQVQLVGHWQTESRALPTGSYLVETAQPLGILACYLLEPESDDGLATWNVFDSELHAGADFPVWRVEEPVTAARRVE
ncbi:MAG TPA: M14 family metallopeptidase [Gemmatimonadaceae bacterium]|nr:M14 family metallopeptidase [Gemmatimonadaceae bacterium]